MFVWNRTSLKINSKTRSQAVQVCCFLLAISFYFLFLVIETIFYILLFILNWSTFKYKYKTKNLNLLQFFVLLFQVKSLLCTFVTNQLYDINKPAQYWITNINVIHINKRKFQYKIYIILYVAKTLFPS